MITPHYSLLQNPSHLLLTVHLPYLKVGHEHIETSPHQLKFSKKPYFLKLVFQEELVEGSQVVQFDPKTQNLTISVRKAVQGTEFKNLSLLGKGRGRPKGTLKNKVFVEKPSVVILQELAQPLNGIGFNFQCRGVFIDLKQQLYEISQLDPEQVPLNQRERFSFSKVASDFSLERFFIDLQENQAIFQELSQNQFSFVRNIQQNALVKRFEGLAMTAKQLRLIGQVNAEQLFLTPCQRKEQVRGLIDISFAFCYQYRCMGGQLSCQSPKTITLLSSLLSCHFIGQSVKQVLSHSVSRALTYPLHCSKRLCQQSGKDVIEVLKQQRVTSLLLQMRGCFQLNQPYYLLNRLYIDSMISFAECLNVQQLFEAAAQMETIEGLSSLAYLDMHCEQPLPEEP